METMIAVITQVTEQLRRLWRMTRIVKKAQIISKMRQPLKLIKRRTSQVRLGSSKKNCDISS